MNANCWRSFAGFIVKRSRDRVPDPALFPEILAELRSLSDAAEVLYLREDTRDDHGPHFVAGDKLSGRNFPLKLSDQVHPELRGLFEEVFPLELAREDQVYLPVSGEKGAAQVFQIRFAAIGSRHILALFPKPDRPFPPLTDEERELAYDALTVLAHVHSSLDFARSKTLRDERRVFLKKIMRARGPVADVADQLCRSWREFLGVPAVRLWMYNKTLDELDLLSEACDSIDRPFLEKSSNRLAIQSFAGEALKSRMVRRSSDPASETTWSKDDPHSRALLKKWPHLICVPLILARNHLGISGQLGDDETDELYGVLDVHLEDISKQSQPSHRLKFLGDMCASALDSAHLVERRRAILGLNKLSQELVLDSVVKSLGEARLAYLDGLKELILKAVNAKSLSIFEYDDNRELLQCITSTGIKDHLELTEVNYHKGDGVTWTIYEDTPRELLVRDVRDHKSYRGKFVESRTIEPEPHLDPFLAVTLPGRNRRSIGVIRVLERLCHCYPGRLQNFSYFDMDLLKLIAGQVSPIIQMLRLATHLEALNGRIEHQLIQPIQGARGYVENLIEGVYGPISPEVQQKLRYVHGMMIDTSDRVRTGKWGRRAETEQPSLIRPTERRWRNLAQYLLSRIIDVQLLRRADGISVHLLERSTIESVNFLGEDQYFAQAIGNVLHNAVKYAYPQSAVLVKADREQSRLTVDITSVGLPIAPSEQRRIFEDRQRGFYAVKHDRVLSGSGQGLYIARQYLRGLGGDLLLLESEVLPSKEITPPAKFPPAARTTFRLILDGAFPR